MKVLIFDSGTLINLSMNGLLYILEELKKNTKDLKFIITRHVKRELVDRPINIPRFELGAIRIQNMIESKIIELPESMQIANEEIDKKTTELMETANRLIQYQGKWVNIVSDAEISCLALSQILTEKSVTNLIAIDERTTRILSEKPETLQSIMEQRLHHPVFLMKKDFSKFKQFKFIRSSELVYVAFKKDLLRIHGSKALEAVIYATKYKGSSISWDEIKVLKKL